MIFSELYSSYYNAVAGILTAAVKKQVTDNDIRKIIRSTAFDESVLNIESALKSGRWQLLKPDGRTCIAHVPEMPLTTLQKRWLKAVYQDPRIRLFTDEAPAYLDDVRPLFAHRDWCIFDKYSDGDDYTDEEYISHFRMILRAAREHAPLELTIVNRFGKKRRTVMIPDKIEYSEKDDKFRVTGDCDMRSRVVNIGRITECRPFSGDIRQLQPPQFCTDTVEFDLYDTRKALERVLMHFAHLEKEVVRINDDLYHITLRYEHNDETELLIRILSFGPVIKVTAPESFILNIRMRLERQKQFIPYNSENTQKTP